MTKVKVVAIDAVNGYGPGQDFDVSEREAKQLVDRRLVKMAVGVENKMAAPAQNKANPSPAAGRAQASSASPAAPASPRTTAKTSARGATPARKRAASSR